MVVQGVVQKWCNRWCRSLPQVTAMERDRLGKARAKQPKDKKSRRLRTLKSTPGRIRTCDLRIRNPLLYPLSYRRLFSFSEIYSLMGDMGSRGRRRCTRLCHRRSFPAQSSPSGSRDRVEMGGLTFILKRCAPAQAGSPPATTSTEARLHFCLEDAHAGYCCSDCKS